MRRVALLLLALYLTGCQSATPSASPSPGGGSATPSASGSPAKSTESGENVVRLHKSTIKTKQGQKWEMEADQIDWMDDRSRAKATHVEWWLIDKEDKRWVKVTSPTADIDMDNEIVVFTGETVARRLGYDENLKVQHLVYKGKERMFYGSQGVEWHRGTVKLTGETLKATSTLDRVQLKGRVKGKSKGGFKDLAQPRKADSSSEN